MTILGLHYAIWIVLILYFAGMLLMGWWSKQGAHSQEGYLLGNRQFGSLMMLMHAFGAGTHPGNVAGVMSEAVVSGASSIWVSWMWLFGTPFYWLIAPVIRRMRCLTMADYFEQRFGKAASILYILVAAVGMIVFLSGVLLATTRTVQGMMGKSASPDSEAWFFGILLVSTAVFIIYSYWGGIIAAIRTDMIQGFMIIALSFLAIPAALRLPEVGGLEGMRNTLVAQSASGTDYLSLFHTDKFNIWAVLLLSINAPLTALAFPHLMSVCGAGRTEWHGRVGFTYGNILKRVCTIGWCVLGMCWLVYLLNSGAEIQKDAAFGNAIRHLLPPMLQGVMLACVMAAAMSSGDAVQVTVAGLFSQNVYRVYVNPTADQKQLVRVTRNVGVAIVLLSLAGAILMRSSLVRAILDYFNILSLVGISTAMGLLWRRMNTTGMFLSTISAVITFIVTRYIIVYTSNMLTVTIGLPIVTGVLGGIVGSLLTRPPSAERIEQFFKKIYVPIGREKDLELSLDEAVPASNRWLTAGGLFIVKPSRQSWIGFGVTLAICLACVLVMLMIL